MKIRFKVTALIALLGLMLLSACGAAATEAPAAEAPMMELYAEAPAATEAPAAVEAPAPAEGEAAKDAATGSGSGVLPNVDSANADFAASHMIIKDGQIKLLGVRTPTKWMVIDKRRKPKATQPAAAPLEEEPA